MATVPEKPGKGNEIVRLPTGVKRPSVPEDILRGLGISPEEIKPQDQNSGGLVIVQRRPQTPQRLQLPSELPQGEVTTTSEGLAIVSAPSEIELPQEEEMQAITARHTNSEKPEIPDSVTNALLMGDLEGALKGLLDSVYPEFQKNSQIMEVFSAARGILKIASEVLQGSMPQKPTQLVTLELTLDDVGAAPNEHVLHLLLEYGIYGLIDERTKLILGGCSTETLEQLTILIGDILSSKRGWRESNAQTLMWILKLIVETKVSEVPIFKLPDTTATAGVLIRTFLQQPEIQKSPDLTALMLDVLQYLEVTLYDADTFLTHLFEIGYPMTHPTITELAYDLETKNPDQSTFPSLQEQQRRLFSQEWEKAERRGRLEEFMMGRAHQIANGIVFLAPPPLRPSGQIGFEIELVAKILPDQTPFEREFSLGGRIGEDIVLEPLTGKSINTKGGEILYKVMEVKPSEGGTTDPFPIVLAIARWLNLPFPLKTPLSLHIHFDRERYPKIPEMFRRLGAVLAIVPSDRHPTYEIRQIPAPYGDPRKILNLMMLPEWLSNELEGEAPKTLFSRSLRDLIGRLATIPTTPYLLRTLYFPKLPKSPASLANPSQLEQIKVPDIIGPEIAEDQTLIKLLVEHHYSWITYVLAQNEQIALALSRHIPIIRLIKQDPNGRLVRQLLSHAAVAEQLVRREDILTLILQDPNSPLAVQIAYHQDAANALFEQDSVKDALRGHIDSELARRLFYHEEIAREMVKWEEVISYILTHDPSEILHPLSLHAEACKVLVKETTIKDALLSKPNSNLARYLAANLTAAALLIEDGDVIQVVKEHPSSELAMSLSHHRTLARELVEKPGILETVIKYPNSLLAVNLANHEDTANSLASREEIIDAILHSPWTLLAEGILSHEQSALILSRSPKLRNQLRNYLKRYGRLIYRLISFFRSYPRLEREHVFTRLLSYKRILGELLIQDDEILRLVLRASDSPLVKELELDEDTAVALAQNEKVAKAIAERLYNSTLAEKISKHPRAAQILIDNPIIKETVLSYPSSKLAEGVTQHEGVTNKLIKDPRTIEVILSYPKSPLALNIAGRSPQATLRLIEDERIIELVAKQPNSPLAEALASLPEAARALAQKEVIAQSIVQDPLSALVFYLTADREATTALLSHYCIFRAIAKDPNSNLASRVASCCEADYLLSRVPRLKKILEQSPDSLFAKTLGRSDSAPVEFD